MEFALNCMRSVLEDEEKFNALHWVVSLSSFISISLVTIKSFFTYTSSRNHKSSNTESYYIKGLLVFRMFWYGCVLGVVLNYWSIGGYCFKEIFFLAGQITIFEGFSESILYYCGLLISSYDSFTLFSFLLEPCVHVFGSYKFLSLMRIFFLILMWIKGEERIVVLGVLFPIIGILLPMF